MATQVKVEEVEKQLESMLDIEKFPPPEDFRKDALVTDESVYEEAAGDLEGFWARQAEELVDWIEKPTEILDESNVPFYKWFADGKLNLSYNCIDRHVEAGNGDRVAYHWRGEEGEERDITYAGLHRDVQRFANALKARGIGKGDVVGIYLPMIAEVGWVTGHSYIIYGPLANGATSVMYEGAPDYPDKDVWWEIIEKYGVTILYTAPTAIRACIKWGVQYPQKHDLSSLRLLGTVGEPINPKAWLWYWRVIGGGRCPIVDTWWQTETGQIMITTLPGAQPAKPGSAGTPLPGIKARVLEESSGEESERDKQGLLVLDQPWPGMLRTLYGDDDRYVETYFERFGKETYLVGDAAREDSDDYFWIIGRIDDVINVSGHRMSTAEIESAIVSHPLVAESACIGQSDEDTGQSVAAFVTLEGDREGDDELIVEIREHVAKRIGKLARPKRIIWADDLPKTRSGKIMRRLLRDIAEGKELGDVTTLRDPSVMEQLKEKIKEAQAEGS